MQTSFYFATKDNKYLTAMEHLTLFMYVLYQSTVCCHPRLPIKTQQMTLNVPAFYEF